MKVSDFTSGARLICPGRSYQKPKVSIVTPTYRRNTEGLLARCLDSAMAQTFEDFEHIIIDDGSSDGSEFTIRDAAFRDDRIVYVRHETNSNLPGLRTNEGVQWARGDAVAFLFDDNIMRPDFIASAWRALESSGADVVYAHVYMLGNDGRDFTLGGWPLTLELLRNLNTIPNGGVLVRRSYFERFGLYDPHILMRRLCDWDLWLRGLMLGAKFCHLSQISAVEHGLISENSIGNTIGLDVKITYAYMQDEARMRERTQRLLLSQIDNFDVFDPSPLLPYVRSEDEWSELIAAMYQPYFQRRDRNGFDPSYPANRAASIDPRRGWNADWSLLKARRRYLVVSNSVNPWAMAWIHALREIPGAIALNCPEWQLAGFRPDDLDLIILLDCTSPFLNPQLAAFRAASVPAIYVLGYGAQSTDTIPPDFANRFFEQSGHIIDVLGHSIYFPQPGNSFGAERRDWARPMASEAYAVVAAELDAQRLAFTDIVPFPFGSVVVSHEPATSCGPTIAYGSDRLDRSDFNEIVTVPVVSYVEGTPVCVRPSWEGLGAVAECRPGSRVIVADQVLAASPLAERVGLASIARRYGVALTTGEAGNGAWDGSNADGISPAAWQQWMANLARCALVARQIAIVRGATPARPRVGVFLNSEMFSGSEVYGLMLARALRQVGCRVHVFIPEQTAYGTDSDSKHLNQWLNANGLEPVRQAPYRGGPGYLQEDPAARSAAVARLSAFMREQSHEIAICSGFLPEFAALPNPVLLFMALFQPSAYEQKQLAFLRGKLSGVISDSRWSLTAHQKVLGAPGALVRPMPVDAAAPRAKAPRTSGPIRIAIGGTLQPRKRQLEAVQAVALLRDRGIPVQLNVYGYRLGLLKSYVDDVDRAISTTHLQGFVRCPGLVEPGVMAQENDIVLSASVDESLPQTLVELMRCGLIGVAGLSGGIDELIEDGRTGYLTTELSPHGLAEVLQRAIRDRPRWSEVAQNASTLIVRDYSIGANTAALLDMMIEGAQLESSPFGRLAAPEK